MKCPKCKFYNICKGRLNETVENCVRFKSAEQTNEEWLRSISTRELAKNLAVLVLYDMPLYDRLHNSFDGGESAVIDACEKWLKEIHNESV